MATSASLSNTYLMDLVAQKTQKAGACSVTGFSSDGKEWGTQPKANKSAGDTRERSAGNTPINTVYGELAKKDGAKNVALYTLNINPNRGVRVELHRGAACRRKRSSNDNSVLTLDGQLQGRPRRRSPSRTRHPSWMWSNLDARVANVALVTAYRAGRGPTSTSTSPTATATRSPTARPGRRTRSQLRSRLPPLLGPRRRNRAG